MNDERRLELEKYFDGELSIEARECLERELAGDPAAMRHLEQLRLLRALAHRHDPSSVQTSANARFERPWRVAARPQHPRRLVLAAAAAAAAILGSIWCTYILRQPNDRTPSVVSPSTHARKSTRPIQSTGDGAPVSPAPLSLELDAQRFAWANGELTSPTDAARIVLDSRPRHGSRSSNVEILAIELAHAPPNTMHDVTRMAVERSVSIRQPPTAPRAGPKAPAASSPPQGWFRERRLHDGQRIAGTNVHPAHRMIPQTPWLDQSATSLDCLWYDKLSERGTAVCLRPGVIL